MEVQLKNEVNSTVKNTYHLYTHNQLLFKNDSGYLNLTATQVPNPSSVRHCCEFTNSETYMAIYAYLTPTVILLGILGNLATFLVLRSRRYRFSSTLFYLSVLAITNISVLVIGSGAEWMRQITQTPFIDSYYDSVCRIWQMVTRVLVFSTIWLCLASVINQFVLKIYPKRTKKIFLSKMVTVTIFVGLCIVSLHALWMYELTPYGCTPYPIYSYDLLYSQIWRWFSAAFYTFIPQVLLLIFLPLIIVDKLKKQPKRRDEEREEMEKPASCIIITGFFYLVFTLMATIINILMFIEDFAMNQRNLCKLQCAEHIVFWLTTLNHANTFVICWFSLPHFKTTFNETIKCVYKKCTSRRQKIEASDANEVVFTEIEMNTHDFEDEKDQAVSVDHTEITTCSSLDNAKEVECINVSNQQSVDTICEPSSEEPTDKMTILVSTS